MTTQTNNLIVYNSGSLQKINPADNIALSGSLEVSGTIYSVSGGIKFPDNTIQITAYTGSVTGLSSAEVSGAITGALTPYALSSDISASFVDNSELTSTLSPYALSANVSSSFTTPAQVSGAITGGLSGYALSVDISSSFVDNNELTSALTPYAKSIDVSASFTTPAQVSGAITASAHDPVTLGTANGLSLSGQQLSLAAASTASAGAITTGAQTLSGDKTLSGSLVVTASSHLIDAGLQYLELDSAGDAVLSSQNKTWIGVDPSGSNANQGYLYIDHDADTLNLQHEEDNWTANIATTAYTGSINIGTAGVKTISIGNYATGSTVTIYGDVSIPNLNLTGSGFTSSHDPVTLGTANGLSLVGQQISLAAADQFGAGAMTATAQTFAGAKTFNDTIVASNLTGTNSGDVTLGTANGLSLSGQQLSLAAASTASAGAITTGSQTLSGDKTLSGSLIVSGSNTNINSSLVNITASEGFTVKGSETNSNAPIALTIDGNIYSYGSVNVFTYEETPSIRAREIDIYGGLYGGFYASAGEFLSVSGGIDGLGAYSAYSEMWTYFESRFSGLKKIQIENVADGGEIHIGTLSKTGTSGTIQIGSDPESLNGIKTITIGNTNTGSSVTILGPVSIPNLNLTGSGITGSHDAVTLGTANGLSLSGQQLSLATASVSSAGAITTGSQTLAGDKTLSGSLTVTGSQFSVVGTTRSNVQVINNNLDIIVTGSNVTGTQALIDVSNTAGNSQFIAQAQTYALVQAGTSSAYPYYFLADSTNKFVALEADDNNSTIYLGGTGYASAINIGTAGSRNISIGNTSGSTALIIQAGTAGTVITGSLNVSGAITASVGGIKFPDNTIQTSAGISASQVTGALASYATLTGVSASFTTVTQVSGAITGALTAYATLTGVSASFTTPAQVTGALNNKADVSASYVVIGLTASLPNERQLSASNGLSLTDNGAGNTVVLSGINASTTDNGIITTGSQTLSGDKTLSGSLTVSGSNFFVKTSIVNDSGPVASLVVSESDGYGSINLHNYTEDVGIYGQEIDIYGGLYGGFYASAGEFISGSGIDNSGSYVGYADNWIYAENHYGYFNRISIENVADGGQVFIGTLSKVNTSGTIEIGSDPLNLNGIKNITIGNTNTGSSVTILGPVSIPNLNLTGSGITGSHDAVTLGTANGLSLSGQQLSLAAASVSSNGAVTTGSQTLSGDKTLNASLTVTGSMLIGATGSANAAAVLEIYSTTKGLLFPRLSGSARAAMTTATGLIVYQTDTSGSDGEGLYIYKSTGWVQII